MPFSFNAKFTGNGSAPCTSFAFPTACYALVVSAGRDSISSYTYFPPSGLVLGREGADVPTWPCSVGDDGTVRVMQEWDSGNPGSYYTLRYRGGKAVADYYLPDGTLVHSQEIPDCDGSDKLSVVMHDYRDADRLAMEYPMRAYSFRQGSLGYPEVLLDNIYMLYEEVEAQSNCPMTQVSIDGSGQWFNVFSMDSSRMKPLGDVDYRAIGLDGCAEWHTLHELNNSGTCDWSVPHTMHFRHYTPTTGKLYNSCEIQYVP